MTENNKQKINGVFLYNFKVCYMSSWCCKKACVIVVLKNRPNLPGRSRKLEHGKRKILLWPQIDVVFFGVNPTK